MDKTMDKGLYDHQKRLESLAFALADSVKDASDEEIRVECYESGYEPSEAANRVRTLLLRDKVIMRDTEYAEPTDAKTSAVSDNSDLRWPRLQQLRQRIRQLRNQINATEKRMGALVRQYLILADIHGFEDLDPIDGAVIPRENKVQVAEADRFQRASLAAITLGTAVAAVLSVLSINFPSAILLALGAAGFSALLAVIIVRWISVTIDATPRNPAAEQKIKSWSLVFGALMLTSCAGFAWLRFLQDLTLQASVLSLALVGFEVAVFSLGGIFQCGRQVYSWSRDLTREFESLQARADALRVEAGQAGLEHDDLVARVELQSPADSPPVCISRMRRVEDAGAAEP